MPNTKSAKKRMHQSEQQRLVNRSVKSAIKTQIRKVREAAVKSVEQATVELRQLARKADKAAAHGVIHANTAARLKSRLTAVVKAAQQKQKQA
jgi:small subunit ribosomal protein S20